MKLLHGVVIMQMSMPMSSTNRFAFCREGLILTSSFMHGQVTTGVMSCAEEFHSDPPLSVSFHPGRQHSEFPEVPQPEFLPDFKSFLASCHPC